MPRSEVSAIAASVYVLAAGASAALAGEPDPVPNLDLNLRPILGKPIMPAELAPW